MNTTTKLFSLLLLVFSVHSISAQTCDPLDPADDSTGIAVDLIISEINPGDYIELYNTTTADIALSSVSHQFCSPFLYSALSSLASGTVVPALGYATVPWPASFTDTDAGGEVILFKDGNFGASTSIIDFVCWGANTHGSRLSQATSVDKWSGNCPGIISGGAIHRLPNTDGTTAASYDIASASSPLNCKSDSCIGVICDDGDSNTIDICDNGVCIFTDTSCTNQNIGLSFGWNMISSYIEPDQPAMEDIFSEIEEDVLLVKDNTGQTYIPSFSINTIGNWEVEKGYKVKTSGSNTLVMGCTQVAATTPIPIDAGWSIISYLRTISMDVDSALSSLDENNILIVKNNTGASYIPAFSINTIGDMLPGQGYKIKMSQADTLIYPN